MFIHFRSSIKDLKRNMLYEIDEQLDQCSDSAMHNSTLKKVGVRKIRENIISHLKWPFQICALKVKDRNRIIL